MTTTQPATRCARQTLVDRHFEGRIGQADERQLREHLPQCDACREHYQRHLLMARLDPRARDAEERLARGLGLPGRGRRSWLTRPPLMAFAAAAAAAVLLLVLWPRFRAPTDERGFSARGGSAAADVELLLYQVDKRKGSTRVDGAIRADSELAVAYRNGAKKRRLLVFGVDEHKRVYWYHPAWVERSATPIAIPIRTSAGVHELPEAIAHRVGGSRLTIYGVFTDAALSVAQIEQMVSALGAVGEKLPIRDAVQRMIELRVLRSKQR